MSKVISMMALLAAGPGAADGMLADGQIGCNQHALRKELYGS
jgi:hypothetical protein